MFCTNCGDENHLDSKHCSNCGKLLGESANNQTNDITNKYHGEDNKDDNGIAKINRDKIWFSWVSGILGVLLVVVVLIELKPFNDEVDNIYMVEGGAYQAYPTITIGEAFGNAFEDEEWINVNDNSPYDVVRFKGIRDSYEIQVDFVILEETFEMSSIKVNGNKLDYMQESELIDAIFSN